MLDPIKIVAGLIGLVFLGILFAATYYTVEEYEAVVLTRFGQISSIEYQGLHFKLPGVYSANFIRTDIREINNAKTPANTYTIDNQEVDVVYRLFYRVPRNDQAITYIWKNVQDYKERLEAITLDRLKAEMGKINVNHVAEKRGELRDRIFAVVRESAKSLGIEVTDFQLPNMEYTKAFKASVDQAAVAKAQVETKIQELEQAKYTADRARTEAKGQADAFLLQREAEAKGIELKGTAEAKAIKAQAEALASNAQLVELEKARRWDGKLPASMLSNVVPFMNIDDKVARK